MHRQRFGIQLALGLLSAVISHSGVSSQEARPGVDLHGDPLPAGAVARLGTIRFRDVARGHSLRFTPDDKKLFSVDDDGSLCWLNAADGKRIGRLDREGNFGAVEFAPDGRAFASNGWIDKAGVIRLWDFHTGKPIRTIPYAEKGGHKFLRFTPDGKTLLTAGERPDNSVRIIDIASGDELLTYKLSESNVGAMALSPDGKVVAVAEEHGGFIFLWEWQSPNKPRRVSTRSERSVQFMAFSPDGRILVSFGDDSHGLCFWDVSSGSLLGSETVGDGGCHVRSAAFSSDGRRFAAALSYYESRPEARYATSRNAVLIWEPTALAADRARDGKRGVAKLLRTIPGNALDLAISSDNRTLKILTANGPSHWDIETGKELTPPRFRSSIGGIDQLFFAPLGKIATVNEEEIRFWDAETGKRLHTIPLTNWTTAALSPDGTRIATSSHDDTVRLFDAGNGREIFRLPGHGRLGSRYRVAFSADGKSFATFGKDHFLRVWDAANGRAIHEHRIDPAGLEFPDADDDSIEAERQRQMLDFKMMRSIFTPDAGSLVVSLHRTLHVFDVVTGRERMTFDAEDGREAVSPDGQWLLVSAWGRTAKDKKGKTIKPQNDIVAMYDMASGKEKLRMSIPLEGAGPVAFAADSRRFAIAGRENPPRIDIHDLTGKKLRSIKGFTGSISHLAFSADQRLACALSDDTVLIWDLRIGE